MSEDDFYSLVENSNHKELKDSDMCREVRVCFVSLSVCKIVCVLMYTTLHVCVHTLTYIYTHTHSHIHTLAPTHSLSRTHIHTYVIIRIFITLSVLLMPNLKVCITLNSDWGGDGSLGCGIGYGYLHRIPSIPAGASPSKLQDPEMGTLPVAASPSQPAFTSDGFSEVRNFISIYHSMYCSLEC